MAAAIDEAERRARDAVPELTLVMYLEPDVDRGDAYVPAERPTLASPCSGRQRRPDALVRDASACRMRPGEALVVDGRTPPGLAISEDQVAVGTVPSRAR